METQCYLVEAMSRIDTLVEVWRAPRVCAMSSWFARFVATAVLVFPAHSSHKSVTANAEDKGIRIRVHIQILEVSPMTELSHADNPVMDFVDNNRVLSLAVGCAALAAAAWACKGAAPAVAREASQEAGIISLGGHADELFHELNCVAHPLIVPDPEQAGFARAMYLAMRHDGVIGRMAADSTGAGGVAPARFQAAERAAALRGIGVHGDQDPGLLDSLKSATSRVGRPDVQA
jgi:hypothetical protein